MDITTYVNRQNYQNHCDLLIKNPDRFDIHKQLKKIDKDNMIIGIPKRILVANTKLLDNALREINFNIIIWIMDKPSSSCCKPIGYNKKQQLSLINNPKIIKCLSEDWMGKDLKKLQPMPIGIGTKRNILHQLKNYLENNNYKKTPFNQKPLKVSGAGILRKYRMRPRWAMKREWGYDKLKKYSRPYCFNKLKKNKCVNFLDKMDLISYFHHFNNYKFTLSPFGNGPDCHRTWEALTLNTIPIVKNKSIRPCI